MAINLNDNFRINAPKPSEERYLRVNNTPYTSVLEANTNIVSARRYVGLTVNINNVEYWYATGILDTDLVIKTAAGGTQNLQQVTDNGNTTTNSILITDGATNLITLENGGGEGLITIYNDTGTLLSYFGTNLFSNTIEAKNQIGVYDPTQSFVSLLRSDFITDSRTFQFPDKSGTFALRQDLPIFLDETSTIADFQVGRTHYYIGETAITYDYDLLPYPLPAPASGFNFVNLSTFDVFFTSNFGNFSYTLRPTQSLQDIQIIDNGYWEIQPATYFDNIYNLQQVTDKGAVTTNAIIVRNNPDVYRTRYSILGQDVQRDDLGFRVSYYENGITKSTNSNSKTWQLQMPDLTGNANNSSFVVSFRPNISGTIAYLSDLTAISNPTLQDVTDNGNTTTNSIIVDEGVGTGTITINPVTNNITIDDLLGNVSETTANGFFVTDGINNMSLSANQITFNTSNLTIRDVLSGTVALLSDIPSTINNVIQNGNSFAANMVIGTNDAFNLSFETSGVIKATFDTTGGLQLFNLDTGRYGLTISNNVDDNNYTRFTGSTVEYLLGFQTNRFLIKNNTTNADLLSYSGNTNTLSLGSTTAANQNVINLFNSNVGYTISSIGVNSTRKFYYTDGSTVRFFIRSTNQLATDTTNYETLVTNDNDIPNKKYVDDTVRFRRIRTITTSTTALLTDFTLLVDCSSGSIIITLPAVTSAYNSTLQNGFVLNIKKIDATVNTVTIDGNASELIDGSLTRVISSQWTSVTIQTDGISWFII